MPSERPEFKFDNPFKVDVSGFRRKKPESDEKKKKKKGKEKGKKKKPKDGGDAEAAKLVAADDDATDADDAADEAKPIIAGSRIKDADVISLKSTPQWLPMPKLVMAAFILNMVMILVAIVVSGLVLGGSITVKANAIGLTQSLVLFSAVFGLVYIGFHCVAARKGLGVGLFRRRYRRPLHTTIVQIGRITVALWLVSMLAVGITIAKVPPSEAGSLSVLKAELACCLINVMDMLVVVFVVERTRMPFVLPWISPPVPEGEALSLHAKALIEDILGDGVAGQSHADVEGDNAAAEPGPVDTPVVPPAAVEAEAIPAAATAAAAGANPAAPAAFMIQGAHMHPPSPVYPGYASYNPYGAYHHPYSPYAPHAVLPPTSAPAPASAPTPTPAPAPIPAPAPALPPSAMATPRTATIGQSSVRPTPSVTFAIPPETPARSSYPPTPPTQTPRSGTSVPSHQSRHSTPAHSMPGLSGYNPGMYDAASAASAVRSEVWSRADEGSYTTAPAGMHTPGRNASSSDNSSGGAGAGAGLGHRPPLPPFAPLPLSSYVSPMQSSMQSSPPSGSMYGPRPAPSQPGWPGRSGRSRQGRGGHSGGDESGYYEPISGRPDGPRHMPPPAGPRVEGKRLFNKAAEGLKAKEQGRNMESAVWEEWGKYKIPGSWW